MKRKKLRKILIYLVAIISMYLMFAGTTSVYAEENKNIEDFLGFYLCDVPDRSQLDNPDVIELVMKDGKNLIRYNEMYYGTQGTTICYEYTDYEINGNVLTCNYDRGYWPAYKDSGEELPAGTHEYTLEDDGTIHSDGHVYYKYEKEGYSADDFDDELTEDDETFPSMLINAEESDFSSGIYSADCTFLGISELSRKDIQQITFCDLNTANDKPSDTWDVSQNQDGKIQAWFSGNKEAGNLMIGSENSVNANVISKSLFRCCTNLIQINFNNCFDISVTTSLAYMFAECSNLQKIEGIENFDTENVESMEGMFLNCGKLTEANVNGFDTSKILSISKMFEGCTSLTEINIDDFSLEYSCDVSDAFKGTVRDGDTPLLSQEKNKNIFTACLLDSNDILPEDTALRVKVINCYDGLIDKCASSCEAYGEKFVYAVYDINGDSMPELVTIQGSDEEIYCQAYEYDSEKNNIIRVEGMDFRLFGTVEYNELYYLADENEIVYKNDSEDYQILQWIDGKFQKKSYIQYSKLIEMKNKKELGFRYAYPDIIWTNSTDNEDEESEQIDAYAINDKTGYASIVFYIDKQKAFEKKATGHTAYADISEFRTENNSVLIYLRMYSEGAEDYCGILQFENGKGKEIFSMDKLINDTQLIPGYTHSYFSADVSKDKNLLVTFHLDCISYGDDFSFAIPYIYSNGKLKQSEYVLDIIEKSSESYTLIQDKKIYSKVGSRKTVYTARKGDELTPEKVWFSNGIVWVQVKSENGETGWTPMGAESVYLELAYTHGSAVKEKVEENKDNQIFFNGLEIPDEDILFNCGDKCYSEEQYENAIIYYNMIDMLKHNYVEARKKAKAAEEKIAELFETKNENEDNLKGEKGTKRKQDIDEKQEKAAEKKLLEQIKQSNFNSEQPLAYCTLDLESDGVNEIIIRNYVQEGSEGASYFYDTYQYDDQKKEFEHLPSASFSSFAADTAFRFWKEKGYIVIDTSMEEPNFEVMFLHDQKIQKKCDSSSDLTSFPVVKFKEISFSKTKETEIYKQYMQSEKYITDIQNLMMIYYSVYDLNADGISELILKGSDKEDKYHYIIYTCKKEQIQLLGTIVNWQNGGNGEIYDIGEKGQIVVNTRLADRQTYYIYSTKDGIKQEYSVSKQALDEKDEQGNYKRTYAYDTMNPNGNIIDGDITTDEQWKQFEKTFTEIGMFRVPWRSDQIAQGDEEKNSGTTEAIKIASSVKKMPYVEDNSRNLSMRWDNDGKFQLDKAVDAEILSAYSGDLDGDGKNEIFCVSYEPSSEIKEESSLRYSVLKKSQKKWEVIAEQEILHQGYENIYSDISCPDSDIVKSEASVFFRKVKGIYQFYYEEYRTGVIVSGEEWYFNGYEFENGRFNLIDGSSIYYTGEEDSGSYVEKYRSLGFAKVDIGFGQLTVERNSLVYEILRMNKDNTKSSPEIMQWIGRANSQESFECFKFTSIDRSADIPKDIQEFQISDSLEDKSEYILPDVADRCLSESELTSLTQEQIQLAINEIFARHGRCFTTEKMDTYFRSKSWYQPDSSKTDEQIIAEFNGYERANEELLEKLRDES